MADTITATLARYLTALRPGNLSTGAMHEAKRRIIDSLGCAIGGSRSEPAAIVRRLAASASGTPAARLLGDGRATTMEMAAFANGVMVRFLDANDSYMSVGSGHPSDIFGAVLAAADAAGASGEQLILAVVAGYEVFCALADKAPLKERGWDQGVLVAPASAAGAGILLGLNSQQMADAIAIAVTSNVPTRQTRAGELSMWKGSATALAAKNGLFAAQLAKEGMTGPTAAFEGHHGLCEQATGAFTLGALGTRDSQYGIERTNLKFFASEYHSQAPLWTVLNMRKNLNVNEIEQVNVQTYWSAYSEIGRDPEKWDPRTRETADHSLPYLLAVALRDGRITPEIFEPAYFLDAGLRPLMSRIRVAENKDLTGRFPSELVSEIEIVMRSGQRLVERTGYPKGHARNPMNDADVESKFRDFCAGSIAPESAEAALRILWRLQDAPSLTPLIDLLCAKISRL